MDISPLEDIGLTHAEIKVYVCLLELGNAKAGAIMEKTKQHSSVVHHTLHQLVEKGLISFVLKGKIRSYTALNPEVFLHYIDEKKSNFQKILPALVTKQKFSGELNLSEIFISHKGVMNHLLDITAQGKKGEEYLFISADVPTLDSEIQTFYERLDPKRRAMGLVVRGIAPYRMKKWFLSRMKKRLLMMKFSRPLLPPSIALLGNHTTLLTWNPQPIAYHIESKQLADHYRAYWHQLWDSLPEE